MDAAIKAKLATAAGIAGHPTAASQRELLEQVRTPEQRAAAARRATLVQMAVNVADRFCKLETRAQREAPRPTKESLAEELSPEQMELMMQRFPASLAKPRLASPPDKIEGQRVVLIGHGVKGKAMAELYGEPTVGLVQPGNFPTKLEGQRQHSLARAMLLVYVRSGRYRAPPGAGKKQLTSDDIALRMYWAWYEAFSSYHIARPWHVPDRLVADASADADARYRFSHWADLRIGTPPDQADPDVGSGSGVLFGNPFAAIIIQMWRLMGCVTVFRTTARPDLHRGVARVLGYKSA